ncbi:hypothetical protein [Carboxylicivirga sp. RSCT41]|uniref:hypothetical protein n=1 Tax=Carboxylicivirga agarovorans TaxID=3417570 RepID=UPI003D328CE7
MDYHSNAQGFARLGSSPPLLTIGLIQKLFSDWHISIAKATKELGYVSTPFSDGLMATINWLKHERLI